MLGCLIQLMLKIGDFLTAWHVYEMYMKPKNKIIGELE
jgi:hypothetical protein